MKVLLALVVVVAVLVPAALADQPCVGTEQGCVLKKGKSSKFPFADNKCGSRTGGDLSADSNDGKVYKFGSLARCCKLTDKTLECGSGTIQLTPQQVKARQQTKKSQVQKASSQSVAPLTERPESREVSSSPPVDNVQVTTPPVEEKDGVPILIGQERAKIPVEVGKRGLYSFCRADDNGGNHISNDGGFCPRAKYDWPFLLKIVKGFEKADLDKWLLEHVRPPKDCLVSYSSNCKDTSAGNGPIYQVSLELFAVDANTLVDKTTLDDSSIIMFRNPVKGSTHEEWDTFSCIPDSAIKYASDMSAMSNVSGKPLPTISATRQTEALFQAFHERYWRDSKLKEKYLAKKYLS